MIIALCHTPFHLFAVDLLSKAEFRERHIEIIYSGVPPESWKHRCIKFYPSTISSVSGMGTRELKRRYSDLVDIIETGSYDTLLLSDLENPLNNIISSYCNRAQKKIDISIFMDGLGVYRTDAVGLKDFILKCIKYSLLKCCKLPYTIFKGQRLGQQVDFVKSVFSFDPKKTVGNSVKLLPIGNIKFREIPGILYIDQPNDDGIARDVLFGLYVNLINEMKKKFEPPYFIKPHHRSDQYSVDFFLRNDFQLFEGGGGLCLEELVCTVAVPSKHISICSSALINLKDIFGPNVHCYRIATRSKIFSYEYIDSLVNLFDGSLVEALLVE